MHKYIKTILITVAVPTHAFATINMAEVNAYAYEGLAEICAKLEAHSWARTKRNKGSLS